jgi:CheY-like chemotaxis protein
LGSARPVPGSGAPSLPDRFTILVIDDDALVLSTLTELLRAHRHRVLEATRGRDGLALTRAERPDLILVDYHMPEMDGLAVVEALKSDTVTRGIPVVAFTSGTAAEANRLVRAGCIGFIPKPFEPGTLPGLVAEFLRATVARDRRVTALPRSRPATAP